jgi:dolichyl-phosphate-mannose-protein mannosyltransferase
LSRATAVFVAAIVVALVVGHLLRDTAGYAVRQADGSLEGDITHYVYWTRLVTLGGIQAAYSGTWPETYAVYPPVTLYPLWALGTLYRSTQDPAFDAEQAQKSQWLHEGIKAVALGWHVLAAVGVFLAVRKKFGKKAAAYCGALYLANPAALYDVAHWGQPDGAHSLFSVLAVGGLSWSAMSLAALAKPQAWVLLPLLLIATLRERGARALLVGGAAGSAVALLVVLPFITSGRLADLLSLPGTVSSVMPVVSADAHNLWWLIAVARGVDPLFTPDATRFVGPLSYRVVAGVLVLAALALSYWLYWTRRVGLAEAAALGVLGWFVFTTQAHENHLFFALPLLALALPERHSLAWVLAILSVTLLGNMVLHDQLVLEALGADLHDPGVENARVLNAALNVLCFAGWSLARISRQYAASQEPQSHPAGRRTQLQHTP